ncbi:MAG: ankyrin repeat domain-containing protein [Solirubrobacteraceae bacterium]
MLYLTYSRLPARAAGRSAVAVARLLLDHGADPNVGYLWEGLVPPFTALTGAFGHGEQEAPPHPEEAALARLLLERGADPNDDQTLYNRQWSRDDEWLELLFEFGLGTSDGGPWARLLGDRLASPRQMLENELAAAAHHGFADRVRLLLAHGVDPAGIGTQHPAHGGRTPIDEAALLGHLEIVGLLAAAGAQLTGDEVDRFISICMAGDRARAAELRAADPTLVERAIARRPDQLIRAAEKDSVAAVELLIELGFDVNARSRTAPLHEAARHGNVEMIRLLLDHGADPNIRDREFNAPPAGWAEHHRMTDAQALLEPLTEKP